MSKPPAAHGPTVHAAKRAKYAAKQERRRAEEEQRHQSPPWASWCDGRDYAARMTAEDARAIRELQSGQDAKNAPPANGVSCSDKVESDGRERLETLARWLAPFFDLKAPAAKDARGRRLFVAEGTEAVRMLVQRCEAAPSTAASVTSDAVTGASDNAGRPPVRLLSILSKPAPFFDPPTRLLSDVERRWAGGSPPFNLIIGNEDVLSEIAGFPIARGALACGVVPTYSEPNSAYVWLKNLLSTKTSTSAPGVPKAVAEHKPRKLLALDAVSNTANLGSLLRTAAAFGIDAVLLSDDCCDAWYRQSVRVSLGHVVNVPIVRVAEWEKGRPTNGEMEDGGNGKGGGLARVLQWLRTQMGVECLAAVVDDAGDQSLPPLAILESYQVPDGRAWCCVLGNEGKGIRDGAVRACDKRIRIGMASGVDSLSLPVAAGILMHGLSR